MAFNNPFAAALDPVKRQMIDDGVPERCGQLHPRLAGVRCARFGLCAPGMSHGATWRETERATGQVRVRSVEWPASQ